MPKGISGGNSGPGIETLKLKTITLPNGSFMNSGGETPLEMLKVYFPNSEIVSYPIPPTNLKMIDKLWKGKVYHC